MITDDLRRSRLTVFFRLLLALPHIVWVILWTIAVIPAALVTWFATLVSRPAAGGAAPLPLGVHPLQHASLRLSVPGREPVPGVHRRARIPRRPGAARPRTSSAVEDGLPARARASRPAPDGGARNGLDGRRRRWRKHQQRRRPRLELPTLGRRARRGVRDPRLVRGARAREDAERAPESRGLRARLLRPDDMPTSSS